MDGHHVPRVPRVRQKQPIAPSRIALVSHGPEGPLLLSHSSCDWLSLAVCWVDGFDRG